jgi:hypothetical protein
MGDIMKHLLLCIVLCACGGSHRGDIGINVANATPPITGKEWAKANNYPEAWYETGTAPVPGWEVGHTPDTAKPGEVILSKRTELGIFSNFAATPFKFKGVDYASVEGFWQATKYPEGTSDPRWAATTWPFTRLQVTQLTDFAAKNAGTAASNINKSIGNNLDKGGYVTFEGQKMIYKDPGNSDFYMLIYAVMTQKLIQNPEVRRLLLETRDLKLLPDHEQFATDGKAWRYFDIWMELRESAKKGDI